VLGAKQESDLANALAAKFESTHPNVKIDVEPVAGMGYDMKLIMQSAAGTLADVVWLCDSMVPAFTEYKVVKDLRPFIRKDPTFNIDDIYLPMLRTGMDKHGRIFQLPRELGAVVMFYNRTLFKRAGLPDPKPDWTYDDFLRMAKKLTIRDENGRVTQYGFSASYSWCGLYGAWVEGAGGRIVSKDGMRSEFSSPESLRGLHDLIDLVTVYKVALPPDENITVPGVDPFAAGKIAMEPQVFPQVPQYRKTMKQFDWDVQVMPAGRLRRTAGIGAAGYGISESTKHPKEAWEFLKFIVSPTGQRVLAEAGSGIPTLKSLANDSCWRNPKLPPRNYDAFTNSVKFGVGWEDYLILTKAEISDLVADAFEKSFIGQSSVEDAFKEADNKIDKVLKEQESQ
jgi:multiple sugar transport system substrate-binding protein